MSELFIKVLLTTILLQLLNNKIVLIKLEKLKINNKRNIKIKNKYFKQPNSL